MFVLSDVEKRPKIPSRATATTPMAITTSIRLKASRRRGEKAEEVEGVDRQAHAESGRVIGVLIVRDMRLGS